MPMELLAEIANKEFPLTVLDMPKIDKLRVLSAAGHLLVELPDIGVEEAQQTALVLGLTPAGRTALTAYQGSK